MTHQITNESITGQENLELHEVILINGNTYSRSVEHINTILLSTAAENGINLSTITSTDIGMTSEITETIVFNFADPSEFIETLYSLNFDLNYLARNRMVILHSNYFEYPELIEYLMNAEFRLIPFYIDEDGNFFKDFYTQARNISIENNLEETFALPENISSWKELRKINDQIKVNGVIFDLLQEQVICPLSLNSLHLKLTTTEMQLFLYFVYNKDKLVTRSKLNLFIYGHELDENLSNLFDTHISRIRSKLEKDPKKPKYLKTIRGTRDKEGGYVFSF